MHGQFSFGEYGYARLDVFEDGSSYVRLYTAPNKTIVFETEEGNDIMVEYFNGLNINKPFGIGQDDDFSVIKNRLDEQFNSMPLTLKCDTNHNFPASDLIISKRKELLVKNAPDKNVNNY